MSWLISPTRILTLLRYSMISDFEISLKIGNNINVMSLMLHCSTV